MEKKVKEIVMYDDAGNKHDAKLMLSGKEVLLLENMVMKQIRLVRLEEDDAKVNVNLFCPDVVFYLNGPQYWAELVMAVEEGIGDVYIIEDLLPIGN